MKAVLWLLALSAVAVAVTIAANYNNGYVLMVAPPYRVEISLNLMVVLLLATILIGYFIVRLIAITLGIPAEVREFRRRRRREKARRMMLDGLKAFFEGRYAKAEKTAAAALELEESPRVSTINALVGARSAHELRKYSQRDEFLSKAEGFAPKDITVRLVTQAELLLDEQHAEEALKILNSLRSTGAPLHTAALRLELKAQQLSGNWYAVLDLLKQLEQRNALDKAVIEQLRRHAHIENIRNKVLNPETLKEYWRNMSSSDKKDIRVATAAVRACLSIGDCAAAHQIIEQSLDRQWDSELAGLYAECPGNDVIRQIERAETWLKSHPNDANLLLALGKLCVHTELWGKAQSYLEASLSVEPSHPAYLALAQLNQKIGQSELARDHYGKGLELALRRLEVAGGGGDE
ncbi:MAG TPA: heme biosynthesis protein HemY [Nitrosospira sp.]|jgi:HemY protein|nr:heme biosynthesis protein HemY [Nitrosospira sp.]